ncbi:MAG: glucose 1-dehydrogenase [Luteitalea sp.]|nr:glucose 1-dehydrogenase [Luteitalea sp.]
MRLADKIAIVTGAGSGIGRAIATRFGREGARVTVVDRSRERVDEVVAAIQHAGGEALAAVADVTVDAEVGRFVKATTEAAGRLDVLVNCAGVTAFGTVADSPASELDRVLAINLRSIWTVSQACIPHLRRSGGSIVNMASITGVVGAPGMAAYATSKGAVITLTRTLALEVAEAAIRVNCICPASIDTPMLQASFERQADPSAARARNVKRHPLGRLGTPEDVANLALFLASDEASFITGGTYVIDGGALLARRWQD